MRLNKVAQGNARFSMKKFQLFIKLCLLFVLLGTILHVAGWSMPQLQVTKAAPRDLGLYKALRWRLIGPYRGGRVTAVAGIPSQPLTYYFGATGGGVWKTEDGGLTWRPISDGFFKTGSVGAIAVSESDPNVVYVGMGEAPSGEMSRTATACISPLMREKPGSTSA